MAACAKGAIRKLFELDSTVVNSLKRAFIIRVRFHFEILGVGDNGCDSVATQVSDDGIVRATRFDASFAVHATVAFDDAMASDAGYPFSKHGWTREDWGFSRMINLSCDGCVASYTKRTRSTSNQFGNRLLKALEHG